MNKYINLILPFCMSLIFLLVSFINLNPYRLSIKKHIIMLVLIFISYFTTYSFMPQLSTLALYIVPILFIYNENHKFFESIIIGIFILIVIILTDNLTGIIVLYFLGEDFLSSTSGYYITCVIITAMLYVISKLLRITITRYKSFILENIKSKYSILFSIVLIITFILFYFNINWNRSSDPVYLTKVNGIIFISYGIVMAIICGILLFFIKKEANFKYKQIQLDNLKEYTDNLEKLYTDMRKFRHDYINIISTMAGFIEDGDIDALEKHFNEHIYPLNKKINKNNYKLGLLKNIHLPEIKGLISAKVIHAQEIGLNIILDIAEPIGNINMDVIDLSRVLGILLDNSIEAAIKSKEKRVNIAFINKNNSVIIILINTFEGNIPPISKLFKEGFSTKGESRGLGLSNLKEIINKYKNISLDTSINENTFCQEITINNK
ncbi:MAG: sensor histidine kinase [Clostridium sp.]